MKSVAAQARVELGDLLVVDLVGEDVPALEDLRETSQETTRTLEIAATITHEFVPGPEMTRPPNGRSGNSGDTSIAGAGFEHQSATGYRFVQVLELPWRGRAPQR